MITKTIRRFALVPLVAVVVGVAAGGGARATEHVPHILVFSGTFGYRHAGIAHMADTIEHLAALTGDFTVEHTEDPAVFADDLYERVDAIMFVQTTGSPPFGDDQKARFLSFFECGGAFIGVHAASDSGDWDGYTDLIGAKFAGHPHFGAFDSYQETGWEGFGRPGTMTIDVDPHFLTDMTLNVEDQQHSATAPWHGQDTFRWGDEFYQYQEDPRPNVNVLLSLDEESDYWPLAGTAPNPRVVAGQLNPWLGYTDSEPVAWTKTYGEGRVFYTNLGHNPSTWDTPEFQDHLLGGLGWTTEVSPDPACAAG